MFNFLHTHVMIVFVLACRFTICFTRVSIRKLQRSVELNKLLNFSYVPIVFIVMSLSCVSGS